MSEHLRINAKRTAKWRARRALALMRRAFDDTARSSSSPQGCARKRRACAACRVGASPLSTIPSSPMSCRRLARVPLDYPWFHLRHPAGGSWCRLPGGTEGFPNADSILRPSSPAAGGAAGDPGRGQSARRAHSSGGGAGGDGRRGATGLCPSIYPVRVVCVAVEVGRHGHTGEALVCGCPVVCTECHADRAEVLRPGGRGRHAGSRRGRCGIGNCHRCDNRQSTPERTTGGGGAAPSELRNSTRVLSPLPTHRTRPLIVLIAAP